jgi:hypothetical protein
LGLNENPADTPYGFSPAFATYLVATCCRNQKLFGVIGYAIKPAQLASPALRVMIEAAQVINKELGHGPSSSVLLLQRLRRLHTTGLITWELLQECADVFDVADDMPPMSFDEIVNEAAYELQHVVRRTGLLNTARDYGRRGDLTAAVVAEELAQRIGKADTSIGVILGDDAAQEIADYLALERLPTGIVELDDKMGGGLQRQGLGMVIGDSGSGKSFLLSQITCNACLENVLSCYASLELPRPMVLTRMLADFTGVPFRDLMRSVEAYRGGLAKLSELAQASTRPMQPPIVQRFPSDTTMVSELVAWIDTCEQHLGKKIGLLTVDYGDKLMAPKSSGKDRGSYDSGKVNWEALRDIAEHRGMWVWTASQSKGRDASAGGRKGRQKKLRQSDVCDSMWKVRLSNVVITINIDEDKTLVTLFVDKHTSGESGGVAGPMATAYAYGRLTSGLFGEGDE